MAETRLLSAAYSTGIIRSSSPLRSKHCSLSALSSLSVQENELQDVLKEKKHLSHHLFNNSKKAVQNEQVKSEYEQLKETLGVVTQERDSALREKTQLQGKLENLEQVLKHMREAAERRQQLELEHEQALAVLNAKQQEIDLLQQAQVEAKKEHEGAVHLLENHLDSMQLRSIPRALNTVQFLAKVRDLEEKCRTQSEQFNLLSKELEKFRLQTGKFDTLGSGTDPLTVCESPGSPNKSLSQLFNGLAAPTGKGNESPLSRSVISEFIRPLQICGDKPELVSVKPTFLTRSSSRTGSSQRALLTEMDKELSSTTRTKKRFTGKVRLCIARYSYNPCNGPNEHPEAELPLVAGKYLYVYGTMDDDGFYEGLISHCSCGSISANVAFTIVLSIRSGVNQGLYLFLVLHFLKGSCLFKMVRKLLLKNDQASSTDGMRLISFQDTRARSIRKACSQKCFRENPIEQGRNHVHTYTHTYIHTYCTSPSSPIKVPPTSCDTHTSLAYVKPATIMLYRVQLASSLAVTPAGPGGNKSIKQKAYLDLEEFVLDSQLTNPASLFMCNWVWALGHSRTFRDLSQSPSCVVLVVQVCAFPNHVQSIEFTTGGLKSGCRNISRMINGNRMHLSSILSLIAKGLNTYVIFANRASLVLYGIRSRHYFPLKEHTNCSADSVLFSKCCSVLCWYPYTPVCLLSSVGPPFPPQEVQVQLGQNPGVLQVRWKPPILTPTGTSNGANVIGYAVCTKGQKIAEVMYPTADYVTVELNRIQCLEAREVIVRTLSAQGESQDSPVATIPHNILRPPHHSPHHRSPAHPHPMPQPQHHQPHTQTHPPYPQTYPPSHPQPQPNLVTAPLPGASFTLSSEDPAPASGSPHPQHHRQGHGQGSCTESNNRMEKRNIFSERSVNSDEEEDGYVSPHTRRRGASVDEFLRGSELGRHVRVKQQLCQLKYRIIQFVSSSSIVKKGGGGSMQIVWVSICLAFQESYGLEVEADKKPFGPRLGGEERDCWDLQREVVRQKSLRSKRLHSIPEVAEDEPDGVDGMGHHHQRLRFDDEGRPGTPCMHRRSPRIYQQDPHQHNHLSPSKNHRRLLQRQHSSPRYGCNFEERSLNRPSRQTTKSPDSGLDCGSEEEGSLGYRGYPHGSPMRGAVHYIHCEGPVERRALAAGRKRQLTRQCSMDEDHCDSPKTGHMSDLRYREVHYGPGREWEREPGHSPRRYPRDGALSEGRLHQLDRPYQRDLRASYVNRLNRVSDQPPIIGNSPSHGCSHGDRLDHSGRRPVHGGNPPQRRPMMVPSIEITMMESNSEGSEGNLSPGKEDVYYHGKRNSSLKLKCELHTRLPGKTRWPLFLMSVPSPPCIALCSLNPRPPLETPLPSFLPSLSPIPSFHPSSSPPRAYSPPSSDKENHWMSKCTQVLLVSLHCTLMKLLAFYEYGGQGRGHGRGRRSPVYYEESEPEDPARIFVALFDYDPLSMSPNPDAADEELPFKEGQIIKVFGDKDTDGFYRAEIRDRPGLIPCNMVSEIQTEDDGMMDQLLKQGFLPLNTPVEKLERNRRSGRQHPSSTRRMVALYDYDPRESSPNVDVEAELTFCAGDVITVFGEIDEDGFHYGELNGHKGLVPSNFLEEVPDDVEVFLTDTQSRDSRYPQDAAARIKTKRKKSVHFTP
ncbi:unnamed protein product [Oncorhynchus mykiss]|uniref:RIMS-binding protein 2 n=1 Tax=Oncorhynchus mykiss TaxID=8022 RepID=A0A060X0H4_ONCMY|nr:unnamed protein product [Oncorhynchus mykiss]